LLKRLELRNFKGFERFTIHFGREAYVVGPNNAGKSTIIAALRTAGHMLRRARRLRPDYAAQVDRQNVLGWSFGTGDFHLAEENLHHEFRDVETRLSLHFKNGGYLQAIWPRPSLSEVRFFHLRTSEGVNASRPKVVREEFPEIAVVPALAPVEPRELVLSDDHVNLNWNGRLASRHFRNHVRLMAATPAYETRGASRWDEFLQWAGPWIPELELGDLDFRSVEKGREIDFYCYEASGRTPREIFWIGDGMQVWLQLLMHLFWLQHEEVVVLDEPDLWLHADLQRRLVRLLETSDCQSIVASHSPEILAEGNPRSVVWVDRSRVRAVRAPDDRLLTELSVALGSQFNLRLARALRARGVLFVEGNDMRVLRNLARTVGEEALAQESSLVTVGLGGFSNWTRVEPFAWLLDELLQKAVRAFVILDRDFRLETEVRDVKRRLARLGVEVHVWHRKELESYLLHPSALARVSGAPARAVARRLGHIAELQRDAVLGAMTRQHLSAGRRSEDTDEELTRRASEAFEALWEDEANRIYRCNAKEVLSSLNGWLVRGGHKAVSARGLSHRMLASEIPDEVFEVLRRASDLVVQR
jgi:energy-coupling factor transporter ATP-binding protein EcfA2